LDARELLSPGTVIRDTYTVDAHIASGAFADVYRVRHRFMGMQAMKVLRDGQTSEQRAKGLYEAFRLAKVAHPSIVRVYDGNHLDARHGSLPYVTMELVEGGTLADLEQLVHGNFSCELINACEQLAAALAHAHSRDPPIVHRDIKPKNVLVTRRVDGGIAVRLADFGLAVPISETLGFAVGHGTLLYRSPESLGGIEVPASDVYSWGLTMYEAATGLSPFAMQLRNSDHRDMPRLVEELKSAQRSDLEAPSHFRHEIHPVIDALVMRCLCYDHRLRIQDGIALLQATIAAKSAVCGDPKPQAAVRRALHLCREPGRTGDSAHLLSRAMRKENTDASSYRAWLEFLSSEHDRQSR
jgi:serine/threonine protein kinase